VEKMGNNTFKTLFLSKSKLQRMVEWGGGVVHSKFHNAKIRIEERLVDNEAKFVLPKVWIQFMGLQMLLIGLLRETEIWAQHVPYFIYRRLMGWRVKGRAQVQSIVELPIAWSLRPMVL
jgi:hypothetical protein